ncbi:hypothetical protein [Streptomyces sp. IBSBF 3136]|uniref:hypothetical protein n=1 Tax=Streptomyces sp. IBSBF 3136 TaxID=2903524 RepID=UPI002FDC04B1
MTGRRIIDVAYGEGWDSGRGAVLGPIDASVAAARDAAGLPYAVVLRQANAPGLIVAHVAWESHYLGLWAYDAQGRRFLENARACQSAGTPQELMWVGSPSVQSTVHLPCARLGKASRSESAHTDAFPPCSSVGAGQRRRRH